MSHAMQKNRGFTLIELMITVAIIAILAAIAFPAFDSQTRKSNRAAAQALMLDLANKQAFYLQSQRQYATGSTAFADLTGGPTVPVTVSKWYTLTITADNAATPPTYTIDAAPIPGSKQEKDGPLRYNSADGSKTRNGNTSDW